MARDAYKNMDNKTLIDSKISVILLNDDNFVKQEGFYS
jgi:hypothetical protein